MTRPAKASIKVGAAFWFLIITMMLLHPENWAGLIFMSLTGGPIWTLLVWHITSEEEKADSEDAK